MTEQLVVCEKFKKGCCKLDYKGQCDHTEEHPQTSTCKLVFGDCPKCIPTGEEPK